MYAKLPQLFSSQGRSRTSSWRWLSRSSPRSRQRLRLSLLISVDGLRPADITDPSRGVAAPTLRAMMTHGAYASDVTGVLPTLTYPQPYDAD